MYCIQLTAMTKNNWALMEEWQKFLLLSRCLTIQDLFIFFFNAMARSQGPAMSQIPCCGHVVALILKYSTLFMKP